jgi:hypothetical protein
MKKSFTQSLLCVAFIFSSHAQPIAAIFSEKSKKEQAIERVLQLSLQQLNPPHQRGDWYEPDTVITYFTNSSNPSERYCYAYENGKCRYFIIQFWREERWYNSMQITHTYDVHDNIQETFVQSWQDETELWENYAKLIYTYNEQNNVVGIVRLLDLPFWENDLRTTYLYDTQNNVTEQLVATWLWTDPYHVEGRWENYQRYTFLYDAQNNRVEELIQMWNFENEWEADWRITYLYDVQNKLIEEVMQWWNHLEEWENDSKTIYQYNAQNNRVEELLQVWQIQQYWKDTHKNTYTYNENSNAIGGISQKWEYNTWTNDAGDLYLHYNNMQSVWMFYSIFKFTATYIKTGTTSIPENSTGSVIKLYPNPISNILYIEVEYNIIPEVKIFFFLWALLLHAKGNQIDVSSLPRGIYVAKVDGVCLKVVKQ